MQLFELCERSGATDHYIDATHRLALPGVRCESCGATWGMAGVSHPNTRLPAGIDDRPYREGWPVEPARLRELRGPLRELLPPELALPPGTEFDALAGRATGAPADVMWLNPWTLLMRRDTYESSGLAGLHRVDRDLVVAPELLRRFGLVRHEWHPTVLIAGEEVAALAAGLPGVDVVKLRPHGAPQG